MNISSRCEYACRAMMELARNEQTEVPLTASEIADRRDIPEKYLVHILLQLKHAGLIRSVRGPQGGYFLAKTPAEISLHQIIEAIDGRILEPRPVENGSGADLEKTWREVAGRIEEVLSGISLREILERTSEGSMYYI
jgi:Rrf2 family cysteine metabolism transcriptional repressor